MNDLKQFPALEKKLGHKFTNADLLLQAITHRSYLNEHPDWRVGHNERLEFLGDAVLELVVTEFLYTSFDIDEGRLTNLRAALVNYKILSEISREVGFEDFLLLSRGEQKDAGSKARQSILANAIEALIGAIYLDGGYVAASDFIHRFILARLQYVLDQRLFVDPKSRFQEAAQEIMAITPVYRVLEESGPDHNKQFVIGVYLGEDLVATGEGTCKQEAQENAATAALKAKKWEDVGKQTEIGL